MTDPPMFNVASAVLCCSIAIVRSLPLPGCDYEDQFLRNHFEFGSVDVV